MSVSRITFFLTWVSSLAGCTAANQLFDKVRQKAQPTTAIILPNTEYFMLIPLIIIKNKKRHGYFN
jgi:hypothetical protein